MGQQWGPIWQHMGRVSRGHWRSKAFLVYSLHWFQGNMYLVANIPKSRLLQTCNIHIIYYMFAIIWILDSWLLDTCFLETNAVNWPGKLLSVNALEKSYPYVAIWALAAVCISPGPRGSSDGLYPSWAVPFVGGRALFHRVHERSRITSGTSGPLTVSMIDWVHVKSPVPFKLTLPMRCPRS